ALLTHYPGEGVNNVGFSGTVRADNGGNAGLEVEGSRLRERLKALEGQALQIQASRTYATFK
ncbi:MAG: hypothetical protein RLZZ576_784, partial [Actinomycetota bacterium]